MILRVRDTIRRALASTGLWGRRGAGRIQAPAPADAGVSRPATALDPVVRDPVVRDPVDRDPVDPEERGDDVAAKPGQFVSRSYSCAAGTRSYKLYTPGAGADAQRALIVMLHGCRQNPDDFAAGTRMNEFGDLSGAGGRRERGEVLELVHREQPAARPGRAGNHQRDHAAGRS